MPEHVTGRNGSRLSVGDKVTCSGTMGQKTFTVTDITGRDVIDSNGRRHDARNCVSKRSESGGGRRKTRRRKNKRGTRRR